MLFEERKGRKKKDVHTSSLKDKLTCNRTLFWNLWKRFSLLFTSLFVYRFIRVLTGGPLQGLTFEKGKEHNPSVFACGIQDGLTKYFAYFRLSLPLIVKGKEAGKKRVPPPPNAPPLQLELLFSRRLYSIFCKFFNQ